MAENLPSVLFGLVCVYAAYSFLHYLLLPPGINIVMTALAGASTLFYIFVLIRARHSLQPRYANPLFTFVIFIGLINAAVHMSLVQDGEQTTNFMLIAMAAGLFLLSNRWFTVASALILGLWLVSAATLAEFPLYSHFLIALLAAMVLSAIIHYIRVRSIAGTEKNQLELEQRVKLYRKLGEAAFEGVVIHDGQRILDANQTYLDIFGYGAEEIKEISFAQLVDEDSLKRANTVLAQRYERPYEIVGRRKNGELFPLEVSGRELDVLGQRLRVVVVRDLSERNRLLNERERFFTLSDDFLVIAGMDGYFKQINTQMERRLGYTEEELLSRPFLEFIHPADRVAAQEQLSRLTEGGSLSFFESRFVTREDENIWVLWNASSLPQEGLIYAIGRDITESKLNQMANELQAQRLQAEVELAAAVQSNLLPAVMPTVKGFSIAAQNLPARYISGDLYDAYQLDEDCWQFSLADIAGKGISAALLTTTMRTLMRTHSSPEVSSAQLLSEIEGHLEEDLFKVEMLVTAFVGRLRPQLNKMNYASAGHGEALVWRHLSQSIEELPATGLPLGVDDSDSYERAEISFWPGDIFLVYSDGIPDTVNEAGEFYSQDRLEAAIARLAHLPADQFVDELIDDVQEFRGRAEVSDDITLLVIKAESQELSAEVEGDLQLLDELSASVRGWLGAVPAELLYDLELAISELITNVMKHAYRGQSGLIGLTVGLSEDKLTLRIRDHGIAFDYPQPQLPDGEMREGGYGLGIINAIFDQVDYQSEPGKGNYWTLQKHMVRAEPAGEGL